MTMVARFFAGVLLANAVPHGVSAVQGKRFPSPFASPPGVGLSGPLANAAWSAINLLGGTALLGRTVPGPRDRAAVAAGAAAMGFFLAHYFGKNGESPADPITGDGAGRGVGGGAGRGVGGGAGRGVGGGAGSGADTGARPAPVSA